MGRGSPTRPADQIYVLNVATGSATRVAEGGNAGWFDDHTLIVGNPTH